MPNRDPERPELRHSSPHRSPHGSIEAAAGAIAPLLMVQTIMWPSTWSELRQARASAFAAFTMWPARTTRAGTRAGTKVLWSFLAVLPVSLAFLTARTGDSSPEAGEDQ